MAPPFKPRSEHDLNGQTDPRRLRTPPVVEGQPVKPKGLDKIAAKWWSDYVPGLVSSGVASFVDGPALEATARAWATLARISVALDAQTEWGTTDSKRIQDQFNSAVKTYNECSGKFGMNPLSRNGIDIKPQVENSLAEYED